MTESRLVLRLLHGEKQIGTITNTTLEGLTPIAGDIEFALGAEEYRDLMSSCAKNGTLADDPLQKDWQIEFPIGARQAINAPVVEENRIHFEYASLRLENR